ncbi:hypothetical protein H4Q26_006574 [Puccinia striiformis f. sp. tritici PST-130]|nr:hypothetical protein H4Q26_006574 [Puccinia striiformis f. sp. tritici PST-130]
MLWICRSTGGDEAGVSVHCHEMQLVNSRAPVRSFGVSRELLAPKHDISSVVYILYLTHVEGVRTVVVDMAPKLQKLTRNLPTTVD